MADFVTSLHTTFGRKLAKPRGSVKEAFLNETINVVKIAEHVLRFHTISIFIYFKSRRRETHDGANCQCYLLTYIVCK